MTTLNISLTSALQNTLSSTSGGTYAFAVCFNSSTGTLQSGVASNTSVGSGGRILVSAGTTVSAVISSGATETVFSGGTASHTMLSGGSATVSSGGTLTAATINGGSLEIQSSGTVTSGSLITISSGTLILDQAETFSGTVAGLATSGVQNIDLVNVSSASLQPLSYIDSGGSGTLTVTDGTTTAQLHLIGTFTLGSFKTSVDGTGGTIITDPPVSNGQSVVATS